MFLSVFYCMCNCHFEYILKRFITVCCAYFPIQVYLDSSHSHRSTLYTDRCLNYTDRLMDDRYYCGCSADDDDDWVISPLKFLFFSSVAVVRNEKKISHNCTRASITFKLLSFASNSFLRWNDDRMKKNEMIIVVVILRQQMHF